MPPLPPRVFVIRHGETEWSLNGRHTGTSDIPLTPNGEKRSIATGRALVGDDRLIAPRNLAHVFVSPRTRARRTLELLMGAGGVDSGGGEGNAGGGVMEGSGDGGQGGGERRKLRLDVEVEVTEDIVEWNYGEYEGITSSQIAVERARMGLSPWDIWRDGCPGGESPADITKRLDRLIGDIRSRFHKPAMDIMAAGKAKCPPCDVLVVGHGHILRAFAARWIGKKIAENPSLILEAGGVGTLSYEHNNIDEPAILLGGSFVVDVVENVEEEEERLRKQRSGAR